MTHDTEQQELTYEGQNRNDSFCQMETEDRFSGPQDIKSAKKAGIHSCRLHQTEPLMLPCVVLEHSDLLDARRLMNQCKASGAVLSVSFQQTSQYDFYQRSQSVEVSQLSVDGAPEPC